MLEDVLPSVPTAARAFAQGDHVTAFVRIQQGGSKAIVPTSIATRIVNERDVTAFEQAEDLGQEQFAQNRAADHAIRLPLAQLPPGEYLLRIEATTSTRRVSQVARFTVR